MELITTHVGADFDAFASALAARHLYPGARLFFPGSREASLRRMLETGLVDFEEVKAREVDPAQLSRVVLCDVRQRDRIGVVAEWLAANPRIELLAYDHHPASPADLVTSGGRVDPEAGSTSTLLVEELRRRELAVPASEATALLLGLHEDTGSFTYATTGARDLEAAAWLLGQGADLAMVRRLASHQLDLARVEVLHRMTQALEVHRLRGHRVGVVALELGSYVDELAPLVSRCLEIFELPVLFALFGEGDAVTVIARGDLAGLDLGKALSAVAGGGGHATAAAARLRGATLLEVRERLLAWLERELPPAARAADIMVAAWVPVASSATVGEAKALLNSRRLNAAPVVEPGEGGRVVGATTRQLLDAAIQHGLAGRPVATAMTRELEWVAPDAPAEEIGARILTRHPRFVLVGDEATGRPLGLVTRMQVLRHLYGRLNDPGERIDRRAGEQREHRQQVKRLLAERLPPALAARVETAAAVSREHAVAVYLVGGLVRDLLLGRENRDLDLVVEGDGIHFARLLAAEIGGRVREHHAFMTAVVVDPEGLHIDVASARSELYREPAALPEVETSALRQDLYRRDFTINTLAIRLGPDPVPELIDYFGGRRDLEERTLRVLHSLSFIDDPTRVLRAVRLEQRLGFEISTETLRLVQVALAEGVFERLSGARLRDELILLLDDPAIAVRGLERLAGLGLLAVLHPRLSFDAAAGARLRQAIAAWDWFRLEGLSAPRVAVWRLLLAALAGGLDGSTGGLDGLSGLAERLRLAGEDRRILTGFPERVARAAALLARPELAPHQVEEGLAGLAGEELLLLMGEADERGRAWVRRDLVELRPLRLSIGGAELVARGVAPGPEIGRALSATRRARLDGTIGPAEELAFALAALGRGPSPAPAGELAPAARGEA